MCGIYVCGIHLQLYISVTNNGFPSSITLVEVPADLNIYILQSGELVDDFIQVMCARFPSLGETC